MLAALSLAASAQTTNPNPVTLTLDIHEYYVHETMTTTDKTAYYYVSYLEKEIFKEKGYNDDETLASEDKSGSRRWQMAIRWMLRMLYSRSVSMAMPQNIRLVCCPTMSM